MKRFRVYQKVVGQIINNGKWERLKTIYYPTQYIVMAKSITAATEIVNTQIPIDFKFSIREDSNNLENDVIYQ